MTSTTLDRNQENETIENSLPRRRNWKQMTTWLGAACLAATTVMACGTAPVAPNEDPNGKPTVTDPNNPGPKTPPITEPAPLPKVDMAWGELSLTKPVSLKIVWNDQLVMLQQKEDAFILWTTTDKPNRNQKVGINKLLTQEGQLINIIKRNDQLLMLYRDPTSVVLTRGVVKDGKMKWTAIRTYLNTDENVPLAMQSLGSEILLFGNNDLLRVDWDTNEVVEVPKRLPGQLEKVSCKNNVCVALFHNKNVPHWLNAKYEWQPVKIAVPEPGDELYGSPNNAVVQAKDRRIEMHQNGLLFATGNRLFFTCRIGINPLKERKVNEQTPWMTLLNGVMISIGQDQIALNHGEKPAVLELPGHLKYLKKDDYQLTFAQSVGGYVLLENDETPDNYKRYSLAYQPALAADLACK